MLLNTKIFTATVEMAKAKSTNNPAMLRAIDRAVYEINRSRYWAYDSTTNTLRLQSTTSRKLYIIDDNHTCEARSTCKHKVARRLMQRYTEALQASVVTASTTAQSWSANAGTTVVTPTRTVVTDSQGVESIHGAISAAPVPTAWSAAGEQSACGWKARDEERANAPLLAPSLYVRGEKFHGIDI